MLNLVLLLSFLCALVSDRFAAIHDEITEWTKQDPKLNDKKGFLEHLNSCDIGQFNVGDTRRWMEYYRKAKKRGVTVAELLFEARNKMLNMNLTYERDKTTEHTKKVFVLDEVKRHELEEIDERLKSYDPARVKRRER